jgi:ATP-dependent DNA helicase RecG
MYDILFCKIKDILRIKESTESALVRLGIKNLRDLLFHKPSSYIINDISPNLSNLRDGQLIQTDVIIESINNPSTRRSPIKISVSNETGSLLLVFFNKIPPFIFNNLTIGKKCTIAGKVQFFDHYFQITHPEFIFKTNLSSAVLPVYPLTYGLNNKQLCGYIRDGIEIFEKSFRIKIELNELKKSDETTNEIIYMKDLLDDLKKLHLIGVEPQPNEINTILRKSILSLAKKELLANQISLRKLFTREKIMSGRKFTLQKELQNNILSKLGFSLTNGQAQVIDEIQSDQSSAASMMRLLQGDVGSGKTLVALLTMLNVVSSSVQVALMAPTDLLSYQHYQFFSYSLQDTDIKVKLLTGKTTSKERKEIKEALANGKIDILIGTHALFQEGITFKDLGYIIIDEQHRFGVKQRLELIKKANVPDVLVMTATPIPRSITLTMFGDMSISQLTSKPKNRLPIITSISSLSKKEEIIKSISKKLNLGEKIYWVCPLIDKTDDDENINDNIYADVITRYQELSEYYDGQVALLHGKMKSSEKDQVMQSFKDGNINILVATTVIEVGIDIQASTLMIIENAEKFGLAQLHQLRGRVGRNNLQSHCILLYNPKRTSLIARKRLEIMKESSDGFYIAEQDLILRGGGEILGTKQSGEPVFYFADLGRDLKTLLDCNKLASEINISKFIDFQISLFARGDLELAVSG